MANRSLDYTSKPGRFVAAAANPSLTFVNRVTVACRLFINKPVRASQLFEIEE